jgi:itaconyl-CoA hydratase
MSVKQGWQGRFLEDFEVGDIYRSSVGRSLTETDNIWFTLITNNPNQIHFNNEYGSSTEFGRCLINSVFTLAVVTGLTVPDISMNGFNLGWDSVRLPHPVFVGDTLYAESEVLEVRESRSNSTRGIVRIRTRGIQQEGVVVLEFERNVMVWKHAHAQNHNVFPKIQTV